jgi:hypothetical protein
MSTTKNVESFWNKPIKNVYLKWIARHGTEVILWAIAIIVTLASATSLNGTDTSEFSNQTIFAFVGLTMGLICFVGAVILSKQNQILSEIEAKHEA